MICFEALADRPNRQRTPVLTYHRLKNFIQHRTSGVSHSLHRENRNAAFFMPLLRSRGRKSLATSGFAGAYLARQGIYTLSPETALLLRNKSTAKGVIYYGSFPGGTKQGLHRNEQPPPTQQGAFLKGKRYVFPSPERKRAQPRRSSLTLPLCSGKQTAFSATPRSRPLTLHKPFMKSGS